MGNSDTDKTSNEKNGIQIRTQFTFITDDITLSCILGDIAGSGVNIAGFFSTRDDCNNNFVRLVVGSSVAEDKKELLVVIKTLDNFDVPFGKEKVIALSTIPAGIPGGYNRVIGSLWCKVEFKAFYVGEDNIIYINVSNISKAIEILSEEPLIQCPKNCCE